jgi:hypothetical protein
MFRIASYWRLISRSNSWASEDVDSGVYLKELPCRLAATVHPVLPDPLHVSLVVGVTVKLLIDPDPHVEVRVEGLVIEFRDCLCLSL